MKTTGEDIFKALENVDEHYIEECQQIGRASCRERVLRLV